MMKLFALSLLFLLSSCAVHLASTGEPVPEVTEFTKGMDRFEVESNLGPPTLFKELDDGNKIATYEFQTGTEPSKTRAAVWLVSDILLAFIPEFIGTPYELLKGNDHKIEILYNNEYIIEDIKNLN